MTRLLAIDADLSAPPSSPTTFRDVTLYAAIREYETVAVAEPDLRCLYARWFARLGLADYVEDILTPVELAGERVTIHIEAGRGACLRADNLWAVLRYLHG